MNIGCYHDEFFAVDVVHIAHFSVVHAFLSRKVEICFEGIPYKGQMLNQIAAKFLDATTDICPNWKMATPLL